MKHALISAAHLQLLHAALDEGSSVGEAWHAWQEGWVWTEEYVDPGAVRLLPLVYVNLGRHCPEDASLVKLKGMYRKAWCTNTLGFQRAKPMLAKMLEAGFRPLLFKGAALVEGYYGGLAERPMSDVDLLVSDEELSGVVKLLEGEGWVCAWKGSLSRLFVFRHSVAFEHPAGGSIDLHRRILLDNLGADADRALWACAEDMTWQGLPVKRLSTEDELLLACIHGWVWNPVPSIRWVADVVHILREAGDGFRWERVFEEAEHRKVALRLEKALTFIHSEWEGLICEEVLMKLRALPKAAFEEAEEAHLVKPALSLCDKLRSADFGYRRVAGDAKGLVWCVGWIRYQFVSRQAPPLKGLPRWVVRKINVQLKGTVRHPR